MSGVSPLSSMCLFTSDAPTVKPGPGGRGCSSVIPTERLHCGIGAEILGAGGQHLQGNLMWFSLKLLALLMNCSLRQDPVSESLSFVRWGS